MLPHSNEGIGYHAVTSMQLDPLKLGDLIVYGYHCYIYVGWCTRAQYLDAREITHTGYYDHELRQHFELFMCVSAERSPFYHFELCSSMTIHRGDD